MRQFTKENVAQLKNSTQVKYALREDSHFFNPRTMKSFGDRMESFGVSTIDGKRYMYRKPSATVKTYSGIRKAGRDFFSIWEIVPSGSYVELDCIVGSEKDDLYNKLFCK